MFFVMRFLVYPWASVISKKVCIKSSDWFVLIQACILRVIEWFSPLVLLLALP